MAGRKTKEVAFIGLASLGLLFSTPAKANNCAQAEEHYRSAQQQPAQAALGEKPPIA